MLGWFLETTLVAVGLAAVAALGGRLRSVGPTARHALWLVVLVRLVTPPLFCWPWAADWGRFVRLLHASAASQRRVVREERTAHRSCQRFACVAVADPIHVERVSGSSTGHQPDLASHWRRRNEGLDDEPEANAGALESLRLAFDSAAHPDRVSRLTAGLGYGWLCPDAPFCRRSDVANQTISRPAASGRAGSRDSDRGSRADWQAHGSACARGAGRCRSAHAACLVPRPAQAALAGPSGQNPGARKMARNLDARIGPHSPR